MGSKFVFSLLVYIYVLWEYVKLCEYERWVCCVEMLVNILFCILSNKYIVYSFVVGDRNFFFWLN